MNVSVIIPTHNRAPYLERSIESVLAQTYKDFVLFVVDDGSTDNTPSVLARFENDSRVRVLKQENKGVSSARNLGIKNSISPFVAFLDSDDEWLPHKLETQIEAAQKHPHIRLIHSDELWIRNNLEVKIPKKFDKSNNEILNRSLIQCLISPSTVLIKRDLLDETGHFDEELTVCEDYDLWLRILLKEDVHHIPLPLIKKYGGHEDQLSTRFFAMDFWRVKSLIKILNELNLSTEYEELVLQTLKDKLPILIKGYKKHQNEKDLLKLKDLVVMSTKLNWLSIIADSDHNK